MELKKVLSKVRAFAWLITHKKANTNDMLQLRRPFKALNPNCCILCRKSKETIDNLFLHCPITLGLWHRIFSQAGMKWVQSNSICNMLVVSFKCFANSIRGKTLWRITSLSFSLSYGLCGEREREMLGFLRTFGRC